MLAKKLSRVWFHTSPATLLLLKGMLKKHVFPHFFATTSETIQIATLGNPQKMKQKKQNMNIIKHIVQNIKSGNHKKVAKFGSLTFFGKNLEQTPKMR